ncbi:polyprenyl synthetase family protein [Amycolatopsis rubida]|uniref:Heptaprenyl diphosphate synthase n=1 Tax=Amycolatopsis rubida TaxID=112413 RepID=A0A1I5ZCG0_9PSEU|nr:polyprenyl synthetase family protein [Amycolatopsis rubida]SFQ54134.1 heptaprenyl diphosphate synthase [Amycolatopsis rubida]
MTNFERTTDFPASVRLRLLELTEDLPRVLRPAVAPLVQRPGKGIRAALVEAAAAGSSARRSELVRLGALVELLHLASLVHDDVVDRAATRRGLPSAHEREGADVALLAGTACVALVGQEAADLGPRTAAAVSRCSANLALGQMMDVERAYDTELDAEDYVAMVVKKTGELFVLSCVLGAGSAGRDSSFVTAVAAFATEIGVCFQIQDDCKDFLPGDSGKPAGTDHKLGLYGLPTLHALRVRPAELEPLLLAPEMDATAVRRIRELVVASGGLDHAIGEARRHRESAFAALRPFEHEAAGKRLREVTDAVWMFS